MKACIPSAVLGFRFEEGESEKDRLCVAGRFAPCTSWGRRPTWVGRLSAFVLLIGSVPGLSQTPLRSPLESGRSSESLLSQIDAYQRSQGDAIDREAPVRPETVEPNQPIVKQPEVMVTGPSRIEQLLARQPEIGTDEKPSAFEQFGYEVFRVPAMTFTPVANAPVGPGYVVGPGDSFSLTLWGRIDRQYTVQVDRNGQIVLPEVGALRVWGMRFSEMEDYLHSTSF